MRNNLYRMNELNYIYHTFYKFPSDMWLCRKYDTFDIVRRSVGHSTPLLAFSDIVRRCAEYMY